MEDIYDKIIIKIEKDELFSFVRYGDGEWAIIFRNDLFKHLKKKWGNSLEPLSQTLREIVESKPQYYFGIQNMAYNLWKDKIDKITLGINTVKADIFHKRSERGDIDKFFEVLSNKKVIIIGPKYLQNLEKIKYTHHIITREYHVWEDIELLKKEISDYIYQNNCENYIFLYSCSLAAKILIHEFSNLKITQIDTGSLLDPYVGYNSRSYHKTVLRRLNVDESTFKYPKIK